MGKKTKRRVVDSRGYATTSDPPKSRLFDVSVPVAHEFAAQDEALEHFLSALSAGDKVAVVTMTGSCCPVTLAHVQSFVEARQLLLEHDYDAVLGALSLNSDEHVEKKLIKKGFPPGSHISQSDRGHLVALATAEHAWLSYNPKRERTFFEQCEKRWTRLRFSHYSMNGADDVIKHKKWTQTTKRQIVMCRPGCTEELMTELQRFSVDLKSGAFIVGPELPDISSTQVRNALAHGDRACLRELLHVDVACWCLERCLYQALPCCSMAAPDVPPAPALAAHALDFAVLERRLHELPADRRRAVQSLLCLAIGDGAGCPFEFNQANREEADELWHGALPSHDALTRLDSLIHSKILERTSKSKVVGTPFCRGYTDDTACADLKMQAVATLAARAGGCSRTELFRCLMTAYLRWAYNSSGEKNTLFQGTGKFTRDLLHPDKSVCKKFNFTVFSGDHEPSQDYLEYADRFLDGRLPETWPSWGNGAVMSLAPQAILEIGEGQEGVPSDLVNISDVLSNSHRHPSARAGARLLAELLGQLYRAEVRTSAELLQACTKCAVWSDVEIVASQHGGYIFPVKELVVSARDGDCSNEVACAFLKKLTGKDQCCPDRFGNFGGLLRMASNYGETEQIFVHDASGELTKEPVKFSQRGLNTVIIAVWCVTGSTSLLEVIQKVVYVGGDADTIGAVAGQLAGPLMHVDDVCRTFRRFVAMEGMQEEKNGEHRSMAFASAKRLFCRSLHFASYDWMGVLSNPPLSNPVYSGLTDATGTRLLASESGDGHCKSKKRPKKKNLHR